MNNEKRIGGLLLHRDDYASFSFFEGGELDTIRLTIAVEDFDAVHPDVTGANFTAEDNLKFIVCFIHEDHGLSGTQHEASFWWRK